MKMKMKVLIAAVSMAAAVQANAAIDADNALSANTGTGAGELFLSVIDRGGSAPLSYTLDLGITADTFRTNTNTFLGTNFAADSKLQSLLSNNDGGTIHWNIAAASNGDGVTNNYGYLTTSQVALNLGNTPQGWSGINGALTKLGTYVQAVNQQTTGGNNVNPAISSNDAILVNGANNAFYDGPNWGNTWDTGSTGHGTEAGLAQSMNMYFVGMDYLTDPNGTTSFVNQLSGLWTLAANGTLSFDAASAPVPLPPAVWLLGSALVGLVGVGRRRNTTGMAAA